MKRIRITALALLAIVLLHLIPAHAQPGNKAALRTEISRIISASGGKVGVGLTGLDFKDSLLLNDAHHYPMQSVYKFPLAIAVLQRVDKGKLSLTQKIHIPKERIDTNTWSPMQDDFPNQDIDITLADLMIYTVSKSDNNGCDELFRLMGGCKPVHRYIHSLGVTGITIAATEAQMHRNPKTMYTNWCQPFAMLQLLRLHFDGKVLSANSNDFLMKCMVESQNSPNRIKAGLPASTTLAHKTGTSGTDDKGYNGATNDVGIITLPNGKHLAIVVYVSDYKGDVATGEKVITDISRLAWDYYSR